MEFSAELHTKQYLSEHIHVLAELAKFSVEFSKSELAGDTDLLKMCHGAAEVTTAHIFARRSKEWLKSSGSQNKEILALRDLNGRTVAHDLAEFQPDWIEYPLSRDNEVLSWEVKSLFSRSTVAYLLCEFNELWISSLTEEHKEIFTLPTSVSNGIVISQKFPLLYQTIGGHLAKKKNLKDLNPKLFYSNFFATLPGCYGRYIAHQLCSNPEWVQSKIWSTSSVLRLQDMKGVSVAHCIANEDPGIITHEILADNSLLKITDMNGDSVAHVLARNKQTPYLESIWTDEVLRLKRDTELRKGITVAHELAENCKEWVCDSPKAWDKHILTMTFIDNSITNNELIYSVAEKISLRFASRDDVAIRLIASGAAFKSSSKGYVNHLFGKNLIAKATELIELAYDTNVKLKYASALYSTITHVVNSIRNKPSEVWQQGYAPFTQEENIDQWLSHLGEAEKILRHLVDKEPDILDDLEEINDINCEPSQTLLYKYAALRDFKDSFMSNDIAVDENQMQSFQVY